MSTVLVIAESEAIRTALDILLSLHGHRVLEANGPEHGLHTLAGAAVDLILMHVDGADEDEPGETSVALMRAIRASRPSLPMVVLTARKSLPPLERWSADAVEHIVMPWQDDHLLYTIEVLLDAAGGDVDRSAEPSDAEIEQTLLRARGTLSRAARQLGLSTEALTERMRRLRLLN